MSVQTLRANIGISGERPFDDQHLVKRIVAAYQRAALQFAGHGDSQWGQIDGKNADLKELLLRGDAEAAAERLRRPHTTSLFYGFDMLTRDFAERDAASAEANAEILRASIVGHLTRLAAAVGAIRMASPEDNRAWAAAQPEDILAALDQTLGFRVDFPNPYPREVGLVTSRGIISYRALQAVYQAWRIVALVGTGPDVRILEIGAGLGRTAYYAWQAGIRNYTIVDVPLTAVAQADFLGRTLEPDALTLAGEDTGGPLRICGPDWFQASTERFDLALNVDSLTEMDLETASDYLRALAHRADCFVSINHERNDLRSADLIKLADVPCRIQRYPYWMREGYTEEIVRFGSPEKGPDTAVTTLPNRQIAAQLRDYHRLRRMMNSRSAVFRRWLRLLFDKNLKGRSPDAGDDLL